MLEYLIIVSVTIGLYYQSIFYGVVVDDVNQVQQMAKWKKTNKKKWWFNSMYGAGLFENVKHDHMFRIFLNCVLACTLAYTFNSTMLALLYICSPANNQVTLWLNGRRYQVALILGLLAYKNVIAGALLFPLSVWLHPLSAPLILLKAFSSPWALLWVAPAVLAIPKLEKWYKSRMKNKPYENYKKFKPRNIILGIGNLTEYWKSALIPTGFTMYHASQWGSVENNDHKERCYKMTPSWWLNVALLVAIHIIPALFNQQWLMYALYADISIFMWLAVFRMHGQVWAQRYATLFNVWVYYGVTVVLPMNVLIPYLCVMMAVTLKDMNMYISSSHYFLRHMVNMPHNYNAAIVGINHFNHYVTELNKIGKPYHALVHYMTTCALEVTWCLNNEAPCLIQERFYNKLTGILKNEVALHQQGGNDGQKQTD